MFKVYDFHCETCDAVLSDCLVADGEVVRCQKCKGETKRLFPCTKSKDGTGDNLFKPFWSDTFSMYVKDREDMKKVRELRKKNGLECVGHYTQTPDRKAIRHNYEN